MFQSLLTGLKGLFGAGSDSLPEGFKERRKLVRLRCSYEVKAVTKGKRFKATMVDAGLQGAKIRTGQKLKVGDIVTLAPPTQISGAPSDPIEARVVWVKRPKKSFLLHCGLVYTSDQQDMARSWIKGFLKELGFTPKSIYTHRRFIRADCFLEARFRQLESERWSNGRVYNLGVGGLLLETTMEPPIGTPLEIEFEATDKLPVLRCTATPVQSKRESLTNLVGMEFGEMDDLQLETLSTYLKHLLRASWEQAQPGG